MKRRLLLPALPAMALCACVTHIRSNVTENPPPREPLSAFQHFRLEPVSAGSAEVSGQSEAMARITTSTTQYVGGTLAG